MAYNPPKESRAQAVYRWYKNGPGWYVLRCGATVIATIRRRANVAGQKTFHVAYEWDSTGNKKSSWAHRHSVKLAKRWAEDQLSKFWESPMIAPDAPQPEWVPLHV